jgi:tripartite-type tricarboxylate transporter receptor subunit TctC
MRGLRRFIGPAVLALAALVVAPEVRAQSDFPNRPIRLIVGFTPGSVADITARVFGNRLGQILGQQIVVESRAGAASNIAAEYVARAPKDGYTLFLAGSVNAANASINDKLSFDFAKDFAPISLVSSVAVILVVHPSVAAGSLQELIALAKSKPGDLTYASTGIGSAPHLSGELFQQMTGTKLVHVPYQGSPQAATDLLAGRVQVMFSPATAVIALVRDGKLKVLASAGSKRAGILPDLPTMIESGMPDFDTAIWFGLSAPAGTPKEVIDKLARASGEALKAPEVATAWRPQGVDPLQGGPDDYARLIAREIKRWGDVVAAAGLKK